MIGRPSLLLGQYAAYNDYRKRRKDKLRPCIKLGEVLLCGRTVREHHKDEIRLQRTNNDIYFSQELEVLYGDGLNPEDFGWFLSDTIENKAVLFSTLNQEYRGVSFNDVPIGNVVRESIVEDFFVYAKSDLLKIEDGDSKILGAGLYERSKDKFKVYGAATEKFKKIIPVGVLEHATTIDEIFALVYRRAGDR